MLNNLLISGLIHFQIHPMLFLLALVLVLPLLLQHGPLMVQFRPFRYLARFQLLSLPIQHLESLNCCCLLLLALACLALHLPLHILFPKCRIQLLFSLGLLQTVQSIEHLVFLLYAALVVEAHTILKSELIRALFEPTSLHRPHSLHSLFLALPLQLGKSGRHLGSDLFWGFDAGH